MTPAEIRAACERQWRRPGVADWDWPAGWTIAKYVERTTSAGYWKGEPGEVWRVSTRARMAPRKQRRRRRVI